MNLLDYVILAAVAVLFVLCARYAVRHRNHACGSGMDCSRCPYHANCTKRGKDRPARHDDKGEQ